MKRLYIVVFLLTCLWLPVHISSAMPFTLNPLINTQIKKTITLAPVITGYSVGKCIAPGSGFTIYGRNFGKRTGRKVELGGHGIGIPLKVVSWSNTQIKTSLPLSPKLTPGQWYYAGIQQSSTHQWLSNINKTFVICSQTTKIPGLRRITPPQSAISGLRTLPRSSLPGLHTAPPPPPAPGGSNFKLPLPGGRFQSGGSGPPGPPVSPSSGSSADDYWGDGAGEGDYGSYNEGGYIQNNSGQLIGSGLPQAPMPPPVEGTKAEADPDTIEPGEIMIASASMDEAKSLAQQAEGMGLRIKSRKSLKSLGLVISVFRTPQGMTATQALAQLRQAFPKIWVDTNHRFNLQGGAKTRDYARKLIRWHPGATRCASGARIGMVDTVVKTGIAALRGANIRTRALTGRGATPAPPGHGTAIAALLAGQPGSRFEGLVPGAQLYAAEVFRQRDKRHVDATSERILRGLDWLASERVRVVNLSFGGSRDMLLELAIGQLLKQGIAVVAAAGNQGPDSAAVYPAAQKGVIAVTAVDAESRIYARANRGNYIGFAAPGVDIWTASGSGRYVSGTSYAVPFVTAAVIAAQSSTMKKKSGQWMKLLRSQVMDLGPQGKDPSFGWGLIQMKRICIR